MQDLSVVLFLFNICLAVFCIKYEVTVEYLWNEQVPVVYFSLIFRTCHRVVCYVMSTRRKIYFTRNSCSTEEFGNCPSYIKDSCNNVFSCKNAVVTLPTEQIMRIGHQVLHNVVCFSISSLRLRRLVILFGFEHNINKSCIVLSVSVWKILTSAVCLASSAPQDAKHCYLGLHPSYADGFPPVTP